MTSMGDEHSLTDKQIRAESRKKALAAFGDPISALQDLGIADRDARQAAVLRSAAADKAQQLRADAEVRAQEIRETAERRAHEVIGVAEQRARQAEEDAEIEVGRRFRHWQERLRHALRVGWSRKKLREVGIDLTPPPKARKRRNLKAFTAEPASADEEAGVSAAPQQNMPEVALAIPTTTSDPEVTHSTPRDKTPVPGWPPTTAESDRAPHHGD